MEISDSEFYKTAQISAPIVGSTDKRIKKVILFGSVFSSQADSESDIDLGVVFPDSLKTKVAGEIINKCYEALKSNKIPVGEIPGGVTLEPVSEGELIAGHKRGGVYGSINEGQVLFERKAP